MSYYSCSLKIFWLFLDSLLDNGDLAHRNVANKLLKYLLVFSCYNLYLIDNMLRFRHNNIFTT